MESRKISQRILLALLVVIIAIPAVAKEKREIIERFRANAMSLDVGRASLLDIAMFSWTTAEDREALVAAFQSGGNEGVYDFLDKQEEKGVLQVPGSLGYQMRYAYQFENEGKRQIVLATNRPILMGRMLNTNSAEYSVSLVVLELDKETEEGEGTLVLGAQFGVDKETGKLTIETAGNNPTRLTKVRVLDK